MNEPTNGLIKELRELLGLTQRDLAQALDVDPMTISRYERGLQEPPRVFLMALETLLEERSRGT